MSEQRKYTQSAAHLAFEKLVFEAFHERDKNKPHWADGLLHVVSHDNVQKLACHHQHSQYHLVLFWLENLFPHAARWIGVRELARIALDFIEHSQLTSEDPVRSAHQFVDSLQAKRSHQNVAQLESLMRCGLARWKIGSVAWRADLAQVPRKNSFAFMSLLEHQQAAYVESYGNWSIVELWKNILDPKSVQQDSAQDVIIFFRRDELIIEFEQWSSDDLKEILGDYRA